MRLELTERNLNRITQQAEIGPEEALNFFYDFCQDIKKAQGTAIDTQKSGDINALYRRLPWIGRFFLHMVEHNRSGIASQERLERLDHISSQIEEFNEVFRSNEASIHEQEVRLKQLEQKKEKTVRQKQYETELIKQCDAMQQEIDALISGDLADLEAQKSILLEEKKKTDQAISDMKEQCSRTRLLWEEKKRSFIKETEDLSHLQDQINQAEKKIGRLKSEIDQAKRRYNALCTVCEESREEKKKLDEEAAKADSECAVLEEQIRILNKNLESKDFSEQQERLNTLIAEKEIQLSSYEKSRRKIESMQEELSQISKDQEALIFQQQDLNYRINQENEQFAKKIEGLRSKEIALKGQHRKLEQDLDEYKNKVSVEEAWLESVEAKQYLKDVESLMIRYNKICYLRGKIEKDWNSLWRRDRYEGARETEHLGQILRDNLEDISAALNAYRQDLYDIVRFLSSKEVM